MDIRDLTALRRTFAKESEQKDGYVKLTDEILSDLSCKSIEIEVV